MTNNHPKDDIPEDVEHPDPVVGPSKPRLLQVLGPGLITGASDDDPSGVATYSQAGAQFGYALSWTLILTFPLMVAIQAISARMGRTTGRGLAGVMRMHSPRWLLIGIVVLLLTANTVNVGADLGAMADATRLLVGGPQAIWVIAYALLCALLQVFLKYTRYVSVLKWLALVLVAYVVTLFLANISWPDALRGLLIPTLKWDDDYITTIVAVFGTTISPYLFFWQASQEAEDIRVHPKRQILKRAPEQAEGAIQRIGIDTVVGMGISNFIGLAIMLTAAAALHSQNIRVDTSAQAAEALRPVAGRFAETLFAIGLVGAGLMAIPVLAGSAAYAIGEALKWPTGLSREPLEAKAFYATIVVATLVGTAINFSPLSPIAALYWSAVVNGVVAVPVMIVVMLLASSEKIMGPVAIGPWLKLFGWLATAAMAASVAVMAVTSLG